MTIDFVAEDSGRLRSLPAVANDFNGSAQDIGERPGVNFAWTPKDDTYEAHCDFETKNIKI